MTTTLNASTAGAGGFIASGDNSGVLALQTAGTTAITVDASQNVGIGTTSPSAPLTVSAPSAYAVKLYGTSANGNARIDYYNSTGSTQYFAISTYNAGVDLYAYTAIPIVFSTNATERMRIDSSGQVGINRTPSAGGGPLQVGYDSSANAGVRIQTTNSSTAGELINFIKSTGTSTGAITWGASQNTIVYGGTSDYRLKDDVQPMTGGLTTVAKLKPCTYKWKSDGSDGQGFIAHELAEVCPDAVVGKKDAVDSDGNPKYQNIDTSFLVATLTAALQETKALIDTQAETINALTARIVALETA